MREESIAIVNGRVLQNVLGPSDENLRKIRKALGVRVVIDVERGKLIIRSEDPESTRRAARLLEQLQRWADREGGPIVADDLARALDETKRGEEFSQTRPFEVYCGKTIRAKTAGQAKYCDALRKKEIVFCAGPAGTGKTYLAVARAVEALRLGEVRKIALARPAVEAGENLGFLPGDLSDKINPYLRPLFDSLADMTQADMLQSFIADSRVEVAPLAYMRGRTLNNAYIILDEAQNTSVSQMKMFLTRMGAGSRVVVCGDATQSDLNRRVKNGLVDAFERLSEIKEIGWTTLGRGDVVRHSLVQKIVDAYEREFDGGEYVDGEYVGGARGGGFGPNGSLDPNSNGDFNSVSNGKRYSDGGNDPGSENSFGGGSNDSSVSNVPSASNERDANERERAAADKTTFDDDSPSNRERI